jgi:enolase
MRLWSFEMGEKCVYGGKGVVKAVENINNLLAPELLGNTRSVSQSVSQSEFVLAFIHRASSRSESQE